MNILIISYYLRYPFDNGASIAQFGTLEYLSKLYNMSLLLPENHSITDENLCELRRILPKTKIYALDRQDNPQNNSSWQKIIGIAKSFKYKAKLTLKTLIDINKAKNCSKEIDDEAHFFDFYSSHNPYFIHSKQFIDKILEIILADQIDAVQIEFTENMNLVTVIPPHVKKIFLQHESRLAKIETHVNAKQLKSAATDYVYQVNKSIKASFIKDFDAVLTFSDFDTLILKEVVKETQKSIPVVTTPFPMLDQDFREINRETFQKPNKLIFVGGEEHFPNQEAVEWFIEEVAVDIFKKFGLTLYVIGKWSNKTIEQYKQHPSKVNFVGFVDDLYQISRNSISIAPIRIGGGLKTKILMAMAQGIPVIATEFALTGINAKHLEHVLVANEKDAFCWSIEYILQDLERTFKICQNAQELIKTGYSQAIVSKLRYDFYQTIFSENHMLN